MSLDSPTGSVLDTKETFLQFSRDNESHPQQNQALSLYFKSLYKVRNLKLAEALEKSHFYDNDTVEKTIRSLRYCNSVSVIQDNGTGSLYRCSLSCKNKFCYLCCRAKSAKLSNRLFTHLLEDRGQYSFYFLTLTLQHNDKIRKGLYLKELKQLMNKLYRSKIFTKHFTTATNKIGIIQAFENKISTKGNHIHSHNLIMCDKIKAKVIEVENDIRNKWKKLSGGSHQIRLDLVRGDKDGNDILGAVKELFKYSIKTNDSNRISIKEADRIGYWMIKTKGQNMLNARGLLRGHGITALKCKYDEKPERLITPDTKYYVGKSSEIEYNYSKYKKHTPEERQKLYTDVAITDISKAIDITDVADEIEFSFQLGLKADDLLEHFKELKEKVNEECWYNENDHREIFDKVTGELKRVEKSNFPSRKLTNDFY